MPTYLERATECLNHNTWIMNCKLLSSLSPSLQQEILYKLFHINWCLVFARWNNIVFHIKNSRYQIMMRCWQNDPDERPAFTELKKQLKDMESLHKVKIMVDNFLLRWSIFKFIDCHSDGLTWYFLISSNLCEVWIASSCCFLEANKVKVIIGYYRYARSKIWCSNNRKNLYSHYIKDDKTTAKLPWDAQKNCEWWSSVILKNTCTWQFMWITHDIT